MYSFSKVTQLARVADRITNGRDKMRKIYKYINKHLIEVIGTLIFVFSCALSLLLKKPTILIVPILYYVIEFVLELGRYIYTRKKPLHIETPDKFNEPYHPSVVFFDKAWNGYSYWMAFSPMPKKGNNAPYIDRWECPCVYQSRGG